MVRNVKQLNVVMSGGGVKGIAYIGAFEAIRKAGFVPRNTAGTSAGALAAVLSGAGYDTQGMWEALDALEFDKLQNHNLEKKVPAVRHLISFARHSKIPADEIPKAFLQAYAGHSRYIWRLNAAETLSGTLQNILTFCREGCLFDGDRLEEWVSGVLAKKGIRTFADLRGGKSDEKNPSGYKVRMTGVDCNRLKIITLPDDAAFYGIEPDRLDVAKAVRISTAVPFAFKPVVMYKNESSRKVPYSLIDGGVLDNFPVWLLGNSGIPAAGFRLYSSESSPFSLSTPLSVFKGLISSVHNIGAPPASADALAYMGEIDTGSIGFLDFGLTDEQKQSLFEVGRDTTLKLLGKV